MQQISQENNIKKKLCRKIYVTETCNSSETRISVAMFILLIHFNVALIPVALFHIRFILAFEVESAESNEMLNSLNQIGF